MRGVRVRDDLPRDRDGGCMEPVGDSSKKEWRERAARRRRRNMVVKPRVQFTDGPCSARVHRGRKGAGTVRGFINH